MIGLEDRRSLAKDIGTANTAGARLYLACNTAGINLRTLQWTSSRRGKNFHITVFKRSLANLLHACLEPRSLVDLIVNFSSSQQISLKNT